VCCLYYYSSEMGSVQHVATHRLPNEALRLWFKPRSVYKRPRLAPPVCGGAQNTGDEGAPLVPDLIHVGHAYMSAKAPGDVLIVGVDSDTKVKIRKGPRAPSSQRMSVCRCYSLPPGDLITLKQPKMPMGPRKARSPDCLVGDGPKHR
jgi:hypothetical protein